MESQSNSWDEAKAQAYLNSADIVVIERERLIRLLLSLFRYRFPSGTGLSLLDIGCGDGAVSRAIYARYPENEFHLLDGSAAMLEKARQALTGENVHYVQQSFEDYIDRPPDDANYDFVYSMNALHHLDLDAKRAMYSRIFAELRPGGLFLNIDPVLPPTDRSEAWQFRLWADWMSEKLREQEAFPEAEISGAMWPVASAGGGPLQDMLRKIPVDYKLKTENKPGNLFDQLRMLSQIGFRDVDCFYKYAVFALFGGVKSAAEF